MADKVELERTVASVVREQIEVSWSRARALCATGRVTVDGERCFDPAARVSSSAVVLVDEQRPKRRGGALPEDAIVFVDRDIVVVDKPSGMLSVAARPGDKGTLVDHVRTLLRATGFGDTALGVVHRLDRETSGLIVLTRTAPAKRVLAAQFRAHDIERVYHAIAHGIVAAHRVETILLADRGDGLRGSHGHFRRPKGPPPLDGKRAVTHIMPITHLAGATLIECRLETGRQHQIRIHLAELGHPLLGERVYIRDYRGSPIDAPRTMLHAGTLGFAHPRSGERMVFQREPPDDFEAIVRERRRPTEAAAAGDGRRSRPPQRPG